MSPGEYVAITMIVLGFAQGMFGFFTWNDALTKAGALVFAIGCAVVVGQHLG